MRITLIEHSAYRWSKFSVEYLFCLYCSAEWKEMSEQLDEATKRRIMAHNDAGEAKSELVIIQVHNAAAC